MKTTLSIILKLVLVLLLALVSWGVALFMMWPLWGGVVIFLAVVGVYVGYLLLRRLWIVTRSRARLAKSDALGTVGKSKTNTAISDLVDKWKSAIRLLRGSSLKRFGNPLRVLPWYAVIGESGSGKTTAITRSGLASIIKQVDVNDPIIQTQNLEWWFFNKSIVIDTAGRYVSPNAVEEDEVEWNKLLDLLAKYRPKDGLDGLVIAIDADKLLQNDSNLLTTRGRALRERIDQTIRLFDRRLPIYILITKCDLIFGFKHWSDALPEQQLNQAMGYLGPEIEGDQAELEFVNSAFNQIEERLKALRLEMAVNGIDLSPDILLFPSEIARLRAGLHCFLSACLGNSPYLEQPLLRGVFISSGKQTEIDIQSGLGALNSPSYQTPSRDKGVFLNDFFGHVLPTDRGYFRPTMLVHRWRQVTRNLAIVCWLSFWIAASLFILISLQSTRNALADIKNTYPSNLTQQNNGMTEWQVLSARRQLLENILAGESNWRTRWLAFSPEIDGLEDAIKLEYVKGMRNYLIQNQYAKKVNDILSDPNNPLYADWVLAKIRIMNRRQAGQDGVEFTDLLKMPGVPPIALTALDEALPPDVLVSFDAMLCAYFAWAPDNDPFIDQDQARNKVLLNVIFSQTDQVGWLLKWADTDGGIRPVTVNQFWSVGSGQIIGSPVRPAYTKAGEAKLKAFLDEASRALNGSREFIVFRDSFERFYHNERINAWKSFATSFPLGEKLLVNEPLWRDMLTRLYKPTGPYLSLFERLSDEFSDVPNDKLPSWLRFVREYNALKYEGGGSGFFQQSNKLVRTINAIGGESLRSSLSLLSFKFPGDVSATVQVIDAYAAYLTEFESITTQALEGEGKSFQLASDFFSFGTDPSVKASDLRSLQDTLANIKKLTGFNRTDTQVIWPLIEGPLKLLIHYIVEQASCSVQADWEKNVLWRTKSAVSTKEASEQLFGAQGSVWGFVSGSAKPFIQQSSSSFSPASARGYTFPLSANFIPFLNTAVDTRVSQLVRDQQAETAKGRSAKFSLTARPIDVNPSAKAKPFAAVLTLQCDNNEIMLSNFNIQASDSFTWSPDLCGDVSLAIKVDTLTLTRRYPGPMGFPRFVQEFQDGERIFTPEDFPAVKDQLDELDIKTISVRYDFVGQEALLKLAEDVSYLNEKSMPSTMASTTSLRQFNVPMRVGACWREGVSDQKVTDLNSIIEQRVQEGLASSVSAANSSSTVKTLNKPVANPFKPGVFDLIKNSTK